MGPSYRHPVIDVKFDDSNVLASGPSLVMITTNSEDGQGIPNGGHIRIAQDQALELAEMLVAIAEQQN